MKRIFVYENGKLCERTPSITSVLSDYPPFVCTCKKVGLGAAIDLGTSTIAVQLVDLSDGKVICSASAENAQVRFGADVISRISECKNGRFQTLVDTVRGQLADLLEHLKTTAEAKLKRSIEIAEAAVGGNNVMLHLLAGVNPESMGEYPYTPSFTKKQTFTSSGSSQAPFGLPVKSVALLPSVSGYLGGDFVAGLLTSQRQAEKDDVRDYLFLDLGTNGELALCKSGKYYCASAATGPAFEGGSIECGQAGVNGAINHAEYKEALRLETIGDATPTGICGSGLIDLTAIMLRRGIIDKSGAFYEDDRYQITPDVYVSQKDIRQFQLAKSAVNSAILTLLSSVNAQIDGIQKIYLAGGAGCYLSPESARATGLLPIADRITVTTLGNACLSGTTEYLLDDDAESRAKSLIKNCTVVSLADNPVFQQAFISNLNFN